MSTPSKPRRRRGPIDTLAFVTECRKELKRRIRTGMYHDKPGLEAALIEYDPAISLIELACDPSQPVALRLLVDRELMQYFHSPQSIHLKLGGSPDGGRIEVRIRSYSPGIPDEEPEALPEPGQAETLELDNPESPGTWHRR